MAVLCGQLTDDVTRSTAPALTQFIGSCFTAILQSHSIPHYEAAGSPQVPPPHSDRVQNLTCPKCLPQSPRVCCAHGECVNGTCECDPG